MKWPAARNYVVSNEMVRACAPGGRVVLADMYASVLVFGNSDSGKSTFAVQLTELWLGLNVRKIAFSPEG